MEELKIAHAEVVDKKRKKLIIPVKLGNIPADELDRDLELYMNRFTYMEADDTDMFNGKRLLFFWKRLHFAMPKFPLW